MIDAVQQPLPLVVLTGFLGSGKTTLLNRALADASMRDTAVIVNEFGTIGVDHLLVSQVADDVLLLASGCVCCMAGEDLGTALVSLLRRRRTGALPPFRRIVLETTGIADPALLLQRILSDTELAAQCRIEGIVTVVDAMWGEVTLERYAECASQVALANRLVISKQDLVESRRVESIVTRLRSINPVASIVLSGGDQPTAHGVFDDLRTAAVCAFDAVPPSSRLRPLSTHPAHHADRYQTFWLAWSEPTPWEDFKAWLEGLLMARGDSILRLKGILQVAGDAQPVIVQGVQYALYPPQSLARWPQKTPRSELVFITRDFSCAAAVRSLAPFLPYQIDTG